MLNTVKPSTLSALGKIACSSIKFEIVEWFKILYQDSRALVQFGCSFAKSTILFRVIMCINNTVSRFAILSTFKSRTGLKVYDFHSVLVWFLCKSGMKLMVICYCVASKVFTQMWLVVLLKASGLRVFDCLFLHAVASGVRFDIFLSLKSQNVKPDPVELLVVVLPEPATALTLAWPPEWLTICCCSWVRFMGG